jgi:hypothetical protein
MVIVVSGMVYTPVVGQVVTYGVGTVTGYVGAGAGFDVVAGGGGL